MAARKTPKKKGPTGQELRGSINPFTGQGPTLLHKHQTPHYQHQLLKTLHPQNQQNIGKIVKMQK